MAVQIVPKTALTCKKKILLGTLLSLILSFQIEKSKCPGKNLGHLNFITKKPPEHPDGLKFDFRGLKTNIVSVCILIPEKFFGQPKFLS